MASLRAASVESLPKRKLDPPPQNSFGSSASARANGAADIERRGV